MIARVFMCVTPPKAICASAGAGIDPLGRWALGAGVRQLYSAHRAAAMTTQEADRDA